MKATAAAKNAPPNVAAKEKLYTCPVCNQGGFLINGLKAHRCMSKQRRRLTPTGPLMYPPLTPQEIEQAISHTSITPTKAATKELPAERLQITIEAAADAIAFEVSRSREFVAGMERTKSVKRKQEAKTWADRHQRAADGMFGEFESIASRSDIQALVDLLQKKVGWWPAGFTPTIHQNSINEISQMNQRHVDQVKTNNAAISAPREASKRKGVKALAKQLALDVLEDGRTMVTDPSNALLEMHDQVNGTPAATVPPKVAASGKLPDRIVVMADLSQLAGTISSDRRKKENIKKRFQRLYGKFSAMPAKERQAFLQFINSLSK